MRYEAADNCCEIPADVVEAMRMKRPKSNHQDKTNEHNGSTVCETRRQQQEQWIHDEWCNKQQIPEIIDTSQLLNESILFRLTHIVCQH